MQQYILDKGFGYKLFMLMAFLMFAMVMYQGHIQNGGIYSILFFGSAALCSFQVVSALYVIFVKRVVELTIEEDKISWKIFDNKKLHKENSIDRSKIKEVKTEINYLTGNIYSNFQVIFILNDNSEVILTDGLIYDFGLKKQKIYADFYLTIILVMNKM